MVNNVTLASNSEFFYFSSNFGSRTKKLKAKNKLEVETPPPPSAYRGKESVKVTNVQKCDFSQS